jgi:hypothetical protein
MIGDCSTSFKNCMNELSTKISYLSTSEIRSDKRGGTWWEGLHKGGTSELLTIITCFKTN